MNDHAGNESSVIDHALGHDRFGRDEYFKGNEYNETNESDSYHGNHARVGPTAVGIFSQAEGQEDQGEGEAKDDEANNVNFDETPEGQLCPIFKALGCILSGASANIWSLGCGGLYVQPLSRPAD